MFSLPFQCLMATCVIHMNLSIFCPNTQYIPILFYHHIYITSYCLITFSSPFQNVLVFFLDFFFFLQTHPCRKLINFRAMVGYYFSMYKKLQIITKYVAKKMTIFSVAFLEVISTSDAHKYEKL